jgi:pimeloyl-ACP methyl ester carboxylesterase
MIRQRRGMASPLISEGSGVNDGAENGRHERIKAKATIEGIKWWWCFIHVSSVLFVVSGVVLAFQKLYTGEECDMTWSRRQFLEIKVQPHPKYRFFKFMDQRDPRHEPFLYGTSTATLNNDGWCLKDSNIYRTPVVLYVPGHGGSYEQSRSLGAHGTQLTERYSGNAHEKRVLQQLRAIKAGNITNNSFPDFDDFFYDVYAVDFGEEGGGFHGALLERQAKFIADSVAKLTTTCDLDALHIVAHSIGGISSRLALETYPKQMKAVRNVITLGTPHTNPVLSWEPTMLNVYRKLQQQSETPNAVIVSISGGLRDEMIPPRCCHVGKDSQMSLLSTTIMRAASFEGKGSPPALGMDHRVIVWCHNLLSEVRSILYTVIRADDGSMAVARITALRQSLRERGKIGAESYDYLAEAEHLRTTVKVGFLVGLLCYPALSSLVSFPHVVLLNTVDNVRLLDWFSRGNVVTV